MAQQSHVLVVFWFFYGGTPEYGPVKPLFLVFLVFLVKNGVKTFPYSVHEYP